VIPETFQADELVNYEFGIKTVFGGNRNTFNASVFLMEWDNLQVAGQDVTGAFGFIGNAGSAEVQGIEVDVASALTDRLYVTAQITYLSKKELTEDQVTDDFQANGKIGDEIPRVPEMTAAFTAQYSFDLPIAEWAGAFRVEGSYTDDSFTTLSPDDSSRRFQDSYSIVNARANFRNDNMDLDLTVFIENMFDEEGDVFIGGGTGGQPTSKVTNRPQTIGVQVTKGFGRT
jgi:outer membrane receptor protein involved in Fe transport